MAWFTSGTYNGDGHVETRVEHSVEAPKSFDDTRLFLRHKPAKEEGIGLHLNQYMIEPFADKWGRNVPDEAEDGERGAQRGRGAVCLCWARGEGSLAVCPSVRARRNAAKRSYITS